MSQDYKVLGETGDDRAVGVLGHNTATVGTPVAVEGRVDSGDGYGLYTDDDAFVGGQLDAAAVSADRVSAADEVRIEFTGDSGDDHGLVVTDNSTTNSEQIAIRADPAGTGELVFQDTEESNYKWGVRASEGDLYLDDHENLTSRVELEQDGPTRLLNATVEVRDRETTAAGADAAGHAVDATGGSVRTAGGLVNRQRPDPTTDELAPGENVLYNADGSGTDSAGDLVYAVNDGGTIKTSVVAARSDATV